MPVIPLMFMIHERRLQSSHDFFFKRVNEILPQLNFSEPAIIVSDEETGIVNAIKGNFPKMLRFRCWLHAYRDIKQKLKKLESAPNLM